MGIERSGEIGASRQTQKVEHYYHSGGLSSSRVDGSQFLGALR